MAQLNEIRLDQIRLNPVDPGAGSLAVAARPDGEPAAAARRSRRLLAIALPVALWVLFSALAAFSTYLSMLAHHHSLVRLFVFQLICTAPWLAALPAIAVLERRLPLLAPGGRWLPLHLLASVLLGIAHLAWWIAMTIAVRPYDAMSIREFGDPFIGVLREQLPVEMLPYWGILASVLALRFHQRAQERAMRAEQLERELAQAKLAALASQLRPHFLFNALHTVSGLIRGDERESAIATVAAVSDLLRYSLDATSAPEVPLGEELAVLRRYLDIESLRYGERLQIALDVEPAALQAQVPRLLLQPLVENAVRHGVAAMRGEARIELRAAQHQGRLRIELRNSAPPDGGRAAGHGVGLANTRARLGHLYGAAGELATSCAGGWFELTLLLPWRPQATGAA